MTNTSHQTSQSLHVVNCLTVESVYFEWGLQIEKKHPHSQFTYSDRWVQILTRNHQEDTLSPPFQVVRTHGYIGKRLLIPPPLMPR